MPYKRPKYVHEYKDRHGKTRIYYNRPGLPRVPLRGPVGSKEFWIDYHAAEQGAQTPKGIGADRVLPGSFADLVSRYYKSTRFLSMKESTQAVRRRQLDAFCREKNRGQLPVKELQRGHVMKLVASMADRKAAANNLLKCLKVLTRFAVDDGMLRVNPLIQLSGFNYQEESAHTWTDEDVTKFIARHPPGSNAHLAMTLMLCTGQRLSDAVTMGWHLVQGDWIDVKQAKTGTLVSIPILPELRAAIEPLPRDAPAFLMTKQGKPFTDKGFGNWMRDRCDEAGLPECSSHGLRSATACRLAEAGCTAKEIMAITGHKTLKEVERYIKAAEQKKLATNAMKALTMNQPGTKSANPVPVVSKIGS
jgi:integrase